MSFKYGNFTFEYEKEYQTNNNKFNIHPDFFIKMNDGRYYYWEHLGMLTDPTYRKNWRERFEIYKNNGDYERVITTDELNGISDERIESVIHNIINNKITGKTNSVEYSQNHYSLGVN